MAKTSKKKATKKVTKSTPVEENTGITVKLKKANPKEYMRLGRHKIKRTFQTFDFNEDEMKQLKSDKGKAFLITKEEFEKLKAEK